MIGGPVGWPIGGVVPSEAEVFAQTVSTTVGASVGFAPLVIGKRLDPVVDTAITVGKAATYRLVAGVSTATSILKALPRTIATAVTVQALLLKQAGKTLAASARLLALPIITGIAYLLTLAVGLGTSVRFGTFAIVKNIVPALRPTVVVRKRTTRRIAATFNTSVELLKRAGKIIRTVVRPVTGITQIFAWTLTIAVQAATRVTIRKAATHSFEASVRMAAVVLKTPGIIIRAAFSQFVRLAMQIYRFFRPRSMKTGLSAGRARGRIEAGHASSTVDD